MGEYTNIYAVGGNDDSEITFNYLHTSSETKKPNKEANGYVRTDAPSAEVNLASIQAENSNGNIFIGWFTTPSGSSSAPSSSGATVLVQTEALLSKSDFVAKTNYTTYNGNKYYILVAKFRQPSTYTVAYLPGENGTGTQQTSTKTEGSNLTLLGATFTRTGYTQTGWATSDGGAKAYDLAGSYTNDAAITLYPVWTANTYTVTFSDEHHEQQTMSVTYGAAYGTLPAPTFAGYGFLGWYTASSGGTRVTAATVVSTDANHTLYAHWEAETYTVIYNANGGTGTMANSVFSYSETSALVPACGFSKAGSTCVGWSLSAGGTAVYFSGVTHLTGIVDDLGGPSGPINLYAVWETEEYTVSFDSSSYLGDPIPSITVRYGGVYGELPTVLKGGDVNYIFDGWFYGSTEIKSGDRVRIADDIELSAHFHAKSVTITLDATTGGRWFPDSEGTKSVVWTYQGGVPSITLPSMTDYEFVKYAIGLETVYWEDGSAGEIVWDGVIDGATLTAVAQWQRKRFRITFDSNGGTGSGLLDIGFHEFVDTSAGIIGVPELTGYTFTGWSPRIPRFMPKENVTCVAQWSPNKYNIAYALVGGEFASGATVYQVGTFDDDTDEYEPCVIAVPAPVRSGFRFDGWKVTSGLDATTALYGTIDSTVATAISSENTLCANVASEGEASGTVYFKNISSEAGALVVLTAQWTETPYTVTFTPNGDSASGATAFSVSKRHGMPVDLVSDANKTFAADEQGEIQAGWSTRNQGNGSLKSVDYPIGGQYDTDSAATLYPVYMEYMQYKDKVVPFIVSSSYVKDGDVKTVSVRSAINVGSTFPITLYSFEWCRKLKGKYVTGWRIDFGTSNIDVLDLTGQQSRDITIPSTAQGVLITPYFGDVDCPDGRLMLYAPGVFGQDFFNGSSATMRVNSYYAAYTDVALLLYATSPTMLGFGDGNGRCQRDGYTLIGWTDRVDGGIISNPIGTNAQHGSSVTFDDGGTGTFYEFGGLYPPNPPMDEFVPPEDWDSKTEEQKAAIIAQWKIDSRESRIADADAFVFYPVWTPTTYTVSNSDGSGNVRYNLNGGQFPSSITGVPFGCTNADTGTKKFNDIICLANPVREGYSFMGWIVKGPASYLAEYRFATAADASSTASAFDTGAMPISKNLIAVDRDGGVLFTAFRGLYNSYSRQYFSYSAQYVTIEAVWRRNVRTKYRVRFNKFDGETGNVTFTTKEHELFEPWTLPKVGGDTEEKSGTEEASDVTTELGWSVPGFAFGGWGSDFGIITDGERFAIDINDVVLGENEVFDFSAVWTPLQSTIEFRADDWQTEALETSGTSVDGLIGTAPTPASKTTADNPGKVSDTFVLEPTVTYTPQRKFGQKVFALVTDYITQIVVLLRDALSWTEKVTKGRKFLLSYGSLINVLAGYADGSERTMGNVKVNGKGVEIGERTVADGVLYSDEVTFRAEPLGGYRFVGWYTSASDTSSANLYSKAAETVVFIDDTAGISLYAKFASDPNGIYEWEGSDTNKLMEWKSKVYVGSKPFNPSALRVDATGYPPVEVTVEMFSSPDTDATAKAKLTNVVSQDSRRLPRLRPERYMQIGVKHDAEVDAIFVGTSMGGLAV